MRRQVRIEFEGAMDHVMARGDRREAIVRDDGDRRNFVRTLGEASVRAGFRVHAYALMSNHYHWLLETPKANLSRGMGWMQNAFMRRINTRHRLWRRPRLKWIWTGLMILLGVTLALYGLIKYSPLNFPVQN